MQFFLTIGSNNKILAPPPIQLNFARFNNYCFTVHTMSNEPTWTTGTHCQRFLQIWHCSIKKTLVTRTQWRIWAYHSLGAHIESHGGLIFRTLSYLTVNSQDDSHCELALSFLWVCNSHSEGTATTARWADWVISQIAHSKLALWEANSQKAHKKLTVWVILWVHC